MVKRLPAGAVYVDQQRIHMNRAAEVITGYGHDELQTVDEWFATLYGDRQQEIHQLYQSARQRGFPEPETVAITRKDGQQRRVEFAAYGFDGEQEVWLMHDVTERQRIEQALRENEGLLRSIVNTAADAIVTTDERGTIESFNTAAERMFGYSAEEAIGQNVDLLMPAPCREEHAEHIRRYVQTRESHIIGTTRELTARRKDGTTFPIELSVSEIDHYHRFTGIIRDISERKAMQQEILNIATEEQRRIGQELHDSTQQDLTGLGLLAQNLSDTLQAKSAPESQLAARLAAGISKANRRMRLLSQGLVPVQVDAQGLMAALSELAKSTTELFGVSCSFKCPEPVEVHDNLVTTHLFRIAQEAVTNATKHAQADTILLSLAKLNNVMTLQVLDNGIGIDDKRGAHEGLGLKIMAYRAGLIGGRLKVARAEGGGTLVTCTCRGNKRLATL